MSVTVGSSAFSSSTHLLPGTYAYWRANYESDTEYQRVVTVLKAYGWDTSETEIDHLPPASAYSQFYKTVDYGTMPAFPLIKVLHQPQRGQAYGGGYATSSKSSALAKQYQSERRAELGSDTGAFPSVPDFFSSGASSGYFKAMAQDIKDKKALSLHATATMRATGTPMTSNLFNALLELAIHAARYQTFISDIEAQMLLAIVQDRA